MYIKKEGDTKMSMNVPKIERPKARFEEIVLLTGETFINVIPDTEAERIPGFIAIRGQSLNIFIFRLSLLSL